MVCSYWAESCLSAVTTVQPSFRYRISGVPSFIIGSMVNVMPSRNAHTATPTPEMVYVGLLVQLVSDAVATKLLNDTVTVVLRELLDGRSHVTEVLTLAHLGDSGLQAIPGDFQKFSGLRRDIVDRVRVASVAYPTAQRGADVYTHDVPISQSPWAWNAVDDLLVDRGTDGAREGRDGG